jgi:PhzF family phenazine biosynthesis protein
MKQQVVQVDAFSSAPFRGNPAAVCVMKEPRDAQWMQSVALEMNLSETAFVVPAQGGGFDLRWFTPAAEVDLCGHATLASAHVLWEGGHLAADQKAVFHTLSGDLICSLSPDGIEMDFPAEPAAACAAPEQAEKALGVPFVFTGKNRMDYFLEVESEDILRGLSPDFSLLKQVDIRGFIVTARAASADLDFVSRFFGPAVGVDEDPVTGSAHCCLGPYWADKLGKTRLKARQVSARGGDIGVRVAGDRVIISGKAVIVLRGDLLF